MHTAMSNDDECDDRMSVVLLDRFTHTQLTLMGSGGKGVRIMTKTRFHSAKLEIVSFSCINKLIQTSAKVAL